MALLFIMELLVIALLVLGISTQVIFPIINDTPLFPLFRGNVGTQSELSDAIADEELARLERNIKAHRDSANTIRHPKGD